MLFDDLFDIERLMADRDDEAPGIASDCFVRRDLERPHPLQAQGVGAFADEPVHEIRVGGAFSEISRDLADPLVDLPEDGLVLRETG